MSFSGQHASDDSPEESGRGSEVEGPGSAGLGAVLLVEEVFELQPVPEEGSRDDHALGTDHHDLLAVQGFLSDHGGKAPHHVAFCVDDDQFLKHRLFDMIFLSPEKIIYLTFLLLF